MFRRNSMIYQAPKGTKDILPGNVYKWHYVENILRKVAGEAAFREIRTPMFEHTELFLRGVGETTDVVQKEMYTFNDKADRSITLKPEGTAPAARAFIENGIFNDPQPTKLFYFTPAFRYENVQNGRLREFHQFGVEVFGAESALTDAEIINLAMTGLKRLGLNNLHLCINSIGCPECRKKYNEALKKFLYSKKDDLCDVCKTRLEKNPMRILDCKEKKCKAIVSGAPVILDYICDECKEHFEKLKNCLNELKIEFTIDPKIVRGLDYYSRTVFEIINDDGLTLCGGGRYDYLIKECGGPEVPAVGFGIGIERTLIELDNQKVNIKEEPLLDLYIGAIGERGGIYSFKLAMALRDKGIKCDFNHLNRGVKSQMKYANKMNAAYTIVIGDDEIDNCTGKIKNMSDGTLHDVKLDNMDSFLEVIK